MPFSVGENVGPYRITEQLGQGGMATVFKAYHAALDRYVALKALHPAFMEEPNFLARFQREARLVAKLEHPNIVPIYDYAEHDGRPYLVMKFIDGETLKARLAHGPISPSDTVKIVDTVGQALGFAHKRGILHRDIKPSNVLLSSDGEIYLADFGLARIAQSGESTLTSDMIVGTPQYISPEQAIGKKELDEGTDIYSLGVMLYELTVGQVPFSADTPFSIIHDHIYTALPMPRKVNPTVSEAIERVLLKALAKDRADRYPDILSMVSAFKQAWQDSPPPAPVPSDTIRMRMEADAKEEAEPVESLTTIDSAASVAGTKALPVEISTSKSRKKITWRWVVISIVLCIGCLLVVIALRPGSQFRQGLGSAQPNTYSTIPSVDLEVAQRNVNEKPDDPTAYLQYASALFDAGYPDQTQIQLDKVLEFGGNDLQLFMNAGETLGGHEAWLGAARMYIRAGEIQISSGLLSDTLRNRLREAIYKSASDAAAPQYIIAETLANLDEVCFYISRARHEFYFKDQLVAQQILNDLKAIVPESYEADLLQAEFLTKLGINEDARMIINTLTKKSSVPEWIKVEAQNILNSIQ